MKTYVPYFTLKTCLALGFLMMPFTFFHAFFSKSDGSITLKNHLTAMALGALMLVLCIGLIALTPKDVFVYEILAGVIMFNMLAGGLAATIGTLSVIAESPKHEV